MDCEKIKKGITLILEGIGEDPDREGLKHTPDRVAGFYKEFFSGLTEDPQKEIRVFCSKNHDEMIILRDISFIPMCEHHLLPFFGRLHIAYMPDSTRIAGFSSLVMVVETLVRRPLLQEPMTANTAEYIIETIHPKGVMIVLEAEHMGMTIRRVKNRVQRFLPLQ